MLRSATARTIRLAFVRKDHWISFYLALEENVTDVLRQRGLSRPRDAKLPNVLILACTQRRNVQGKLREKEEERERKKEEEEEEEEREREREREKRGGRVERENSELREDS